MRVAAVDIGTNTTRLLVAEVVVGGLIPSEQIRSLDRRSTLTRLGEDVDATGTLAPEAVDRTIEALTGYGEAIRSWDVDVIRAVATSAARDARRTKRFFDRAELCLGVRPEVITGEDEGALTFAGVAVGIDREQSMLVIDVGGGSTEVVGGSAAVEHGVTVDIGSVRMTERHLHSKPATAEHIANAEAAADRLFAGIEVPEADLVIGVGGTFKSLAAINLDLEAHNRKRVHGSTLTAAEMVGLVRTLASRTLEELEAIPSLDPARAPVIVGGAVVASRAMVSCRADSVSISEFDILDGLALDAARR